MPMIISFNAAEYAPIGAGMIANFAMIFDLTSQFAASSPKYSMTCSDLQMFKVTHLIAK